MNAHRAPQEREGIGSKTRAWAPATADVYYAPFGQGMSPSDFLLYSTCVAIWGSTWLAITFQLGVVPVEVSIAYRFGLAAALLLIYCVVRGLPLRYCLRDHLWMVLQGAFLFALNYVLTYHAERFIPSGLAAVGFTAIVFLNIVGTRVFFGNPIHRPMVAGAILGSVGISLVFWQDLTRFSEGDGSWLGLGLIVGSAAVSSLGNMIATRNQKHGLPIVPSNAYGMVYGALLVGGLAGATGKAFSLDLSWSYVVSLGYLALFGSVVAFGAYLTLLGRIGADRAAYVSVLFPLVALGLSSWVEHFPWRWTTIVGMAASVAGNLIILRRRPLRLLPQVAREERFARDSRRSIHGMDVAPGGTQG